MITVFGSINLDLVVAVPKLPEAGETTIGPDHQTFPGGKGANQALAAKRAGADVLMVAAVGNDAFAAPALMNLQAAGVELTAVRKLDGSTGLAFIGVDPKGENQIIVAGGANGRIDADWLAPVLQKGNCLLLQGESPFNETVRAMEKAKEVGATVIWNPAPVPQAKIENCLKSVDILVVNENEAAQIAQKLQISADPTEFIEALGSDERTIVVTLGERGILAGRRGAEYRIVSPEISVVDTTGAGDAFCGSLAAALDLGKDFERALKEAVAAGALACTVAGAQSSAPAQSEICRLADKMP